MFDYHILLRVIPDKILGYLSPRYCPLDGNETVRYYNTAVNEDQPVYGDEKK